jgi:hypothetical protein
MAQNASESGLGVITRRIFVAALAGTCLPQPLVLEAIAAERMPHRLTISGVPRSPFFEIRDYGTECPAIFGGALRLENGKFLFAFESLEARERAWREWSADPRWIAVRRNAVLNEIALYRAI